MSALPIEGELFDEKYVIGPVLGIGGMAAVLAAKHLGLDEMVALKVLLPECCDDAAVVDRFVQEGKTASKIRSEHVVRMLDVGVASGRAYIVMEYLRGQDLAALLREGGPLALATAVDLLLQATEAIGEGHALGIIHRDLKPANLFLTHRVDGAPCLKVLDFGISKMPRAALGTTGGSAPTLPSVVMGSPQYMSPEQMMSAGAADQRSDIWSLGATLSELLTGQIAFDGTTTTEVCARVLQGAPVPLLQLRPELPSEMDVIISRCLEKDPERRYANVAELARALAPFGSARARASAESIGRVADGANADAPSEIRPPSLSGAGTMRPTAAEMLAVPARRRRLSGYLPAALLCVVAVVAGGFVLGVVPFRAARPVAAADARAPSPLGSESLAAPLPPSPLPDAPPLPSSAMPASPVKHHRRETLGARLTTDANAADAGR